MPVVILTLFHILFFFEIYRRPYVLATSEFIHTIFPSWVWMGRQIRKLRSLKAEPFYWLNFHSHTFHSCYYPPNALTAFISSFLSLDGSFKLKVYSTYIHLYVQSIFWYLTLSCYFNPSISLFGAITFTYCGWNIRIQPCIIYTMTWVPLLFYPNWLISSIALGMCILSGYYPYLIYFLPIAVILNPTCLFGILLGLPQLIPFVKYLPKTVKMEESKEIESGHWENQWYFGLTPIIFLLKPIYIIYSILYIVTAYCSKSILPRVYQRSYLLLTYSLILISLNNIKFSYAILILHMFDLWFHNRKLIPTRPYTEMQKNPKWAFDTTLTRFLSDNLGKERVSGLPYPLQTGHINEFRTLGYCGTMANKLMIKFRGKSSPNCMGRNDWFEEYNDDKGLERYRVKYAITGKKINWKPTGIHNLWENPRS